MTTAEVRAIFDDLKAELVPLIARDRGARRPVARGRARGRLRRRRAAGALPRDRRRASASGRAPWRLDPTAHPFASGGGVDDIRHHDLLRRRQPRLDLRDDARVRPRALRAPGRPGARAHAARLAASRSACTSRRAACGRTSSAAACRSGAASTRACRSRSRRQLGVGRARALVRGRQPRASVADPHPRGRGDLQHARHPALRARAGHRQRADRAARPAGGVEREDGRVPRRRGAARRRGRAPGRALVGRRRSATSRPTRSAT